MDIPGTVIASDGTTTHINRAGVQASFAAGGASYFTSASAGFAGSLAAGGSGGPSTSSYPTVIPITERLSRPMAFDRVS